MSCTHCLRDVCHTGCVSTASCRPKIYISWLFCDWFLEVWLSPGKIIGKYGAVTKTSLRLLCQWDRLSANTSYSPPTCSKGTFTSKVSVSLLLGPLLAGNCRRVWMKTVGSPNNLVATKAITEVFGDFGMHKFSLTIGCCHMVRDRSLGLCDWGLSNWPYIVTVTSHDQNGGLIKVTWLTVKCLQNRNTTVHLVKLHKHTHQSVMADFSSRCSSAVWRNTEISVLFKDTSKFTVNGQPAHHLSHGHQWSEWWSGSVKEEPYRVILNRKIQKQITEKDVNNQTVAYGAEMKCSNQYFLGRWLIPASLRLHSLSLL